MNDEIDLIEQEQHQTFLEALAIPDPDPESLPDISEPTAIALQAETCGRLLRAAVRQEEIVERMDARRKEEDAAWRAMIVKQQDRADQWREMVRAWMLRTDTQQIKTPWWTAFLTKGRTKKVVLDEDKVIKVCQAVYPKAIKMKPSLIKAELDVAVDSLPKHFVGIVEEQVGEPSLVIRKE